MMKYLKRYLLALMFILLCGIISSVNYAFAEAHEIVKINGVDYLDGDTNYPFYEEGSHGGSALDLSSVYTKTRTAEWIQFVFTSLDVMYESDESRSRTDSIWENLNTGCLYTDSNGAPSRILAPTAFSRRAFILMNDVAIEHRKNQ